MAILKNISCVIEDKDLIIKKFDMGNDQINKGSVLTVSEGQVAIFIYKGKLADVYLPGYYKLDTDNMPILTKLMSWKYGFETPFKADIYFVSTKMFTNQKWGTSNPIILRDSEFGAVRIRAYGTYAFKVDDAYIFLKNITGNCNSYSSEEIQNYLRSMLVSGISDSLGESKISVLDLAANINEMEDIVENKLKESFKEIGLEFSKINIENFSLPEELEKALDENSALSMYRKNIDIYQTKGRTDALLNASKNEGSVGGFMGVGMGLNMGKQMTQELTSENKTLTCPNCNKQVSANSKFCSECGSKLIPVCPNCKKEYPIGTKFCSECGTKL